MTVREDCSFTITAVDPDGGVYLGSGTISGNSVSGVVYNYCGPISFSGTINGYSISGTCEGSGVSCIWSGSKQ